jgi:hypothetical protein
LQAGDQIAEYRPRREAADDAQHAGRRQQTGTELARTGKRDAAGQDAAPNDASHPINTREALREYDAGLFALVHETMAYEGRVDWRFHP